MTNETGKDKRMSVDEVVEEAARLHQQGQLERAGELYDAVLAASPRNPNALHFLGILKHQLGDSDHGIDLIRRAVEIDPNYVDAHNNLGNVLKELGRRQEAITAYKRVLELDDTHAGAHHNLGFAYRGTGRVEDAIREFERALELEPTSVETLVGLGNVLKATPRLDEAIGALRRAIELAPGHDLANISLARILVYSNRVEEATVAYRNWLAQDPQNPVALHMFSALTKINVPDRASDGYIRKTFDSFADGFNEKLERLEYQAPKLVGEALARQLERQAAPVEILDLGCGTGLCGPLLAPFASLLVGLDLSKGMLRKAKAVGVYNQLIAAEITEFLGETKRSFDAIVSADTFCYFGPIASVLEGAARVLRPGGTLIFTVEHAVRDVPKLGFRLNHHGRYSHGREYIERSIDQAGLVVTTIGTETLRQEVKQPVPGLVVTASLPVDAPA